MIARRPWDDLRQLKLAQVGAQRIERGERRLARHGVRIGHHISHGPEVIGEPMLTSIEL